MNLQNLTNEQFDIWAAGFFDADGCFQSHHQGKNMGIYLSICQADPTILFEFKRRYGGSIGHNKANVKANQVKSFYKYSTTSYDTVLAMIKRIAPYLVSKKAQANIIIPYLESKQWITMTKEDYDKFFTELSSMKKLNITLDKLSEDDFNTLTNKNKSELKAAGF